MFRSGFKHGILSSSHFQIIRWECKSHGATLNGRMTLGVRRPCFLERETGYHLSSNSVARGKRTQLSTYTNKIPFLVYSTGSYYRVILHTYPQVIQCCSNNMILWINTSTVHFWQYQNLIFKPLLQKEVDWSHVFDH